MDNQQVTDKELGWLAGAFDADGFMSMHRYGNNSRIELGFTNTSKDFLCKIRSICKKIGVNLHVQEKTRAKSYWSRAWQLRCGKMSLVVLLLSLLIPLLTVKQERAEILLNFCERRLTLAKEMYGGNLAALARGYGYTEDDEWYFEKFKELNKRVTSTTISKGSTDQGVGKRKTQNWLTCDDIV
jgi:hypothetical protein